MLVFRRIVPQSGGRALTEKVMGRELSGILKVSDSVS